MNDRYEWPGGREALLRFGPDRGPTLLILPPLFEEANRMRRCLVETMRMLGNDFGIATALPDLPGTGDSIVATVDARFKDWGSAISACSASLPQPCMTVAIRGGALLDGFADVQYRWRLSPISGRKLLRDMIRAVTISSEVKSVELEAQARIEPTMLAGNLIHPALFAALDAAVPIDDPHIRTVGTAGEAGEFDHQIAAAALWRRAEPGEDEELVNAMAEYIERWMHACVAR